MVITRRFRWAYSENAVNDHYFTFDLQSLSIALYKVTNPYQE